MTILNHFPKKSFYPSQREALQEIENALNKGAKYIILEMGTGGGKSVIMYTVSRMLGSAHIVVMQRILQKQYTQTLSLPSVDGRSNSPCLFYKYRNQDVNCDSGKCITDKRFRCDFKPVLRVSVVVNDFIKKHYTPRLRPEVYKAFERFNLTSDATIDQLKDSFRKLVLLHHPDVGGDPEEFILDKSNFELAEMHLKDKPQIAQTRVNKNFACSSARGDLYWQGNIHCKYWEQKVNAISSPIVVHNYPYLINESNFVGDFGTKELLGCDEAHNLTKILVEFIKIMINTDDINRILSKHIIENYGNDIKQWIPYLTELKKHMDIRLSEEKENLEIMVQFGSDNSKIEEKELIVYKLDDLDNKLSQFFCDYNSNPDNWTIMIYYDRNTINKIELKPIFIGGHAERLLFRLGNKILLMSATILDPITFCNELGIPLAQAQYINVPSSFNPERSPIYPLNTGKINSKNFEEKLPDSIKALENVLDIHSNQKGIIHCGSGKIRNLILNNIGTQYRSRLLVPMASNKKLVMEKHTTSLNTILLSISDEEGVSLDDDLSRFNYFPILPFLSLSDVRTAKISEQDKILETEAKERGEPFVSRYEIDMLRRLIQGAGRSTRNENDYSFTYIAPSTLAYYINKFSKYFEYRGFYPSSFAFFKSRIKWDREGMGKNII